MSEETEKWIKDFEQKVEGSQESNQKMEKEAERRRREDYERQQRQMEEMQRKNQEQQEQMNRIAQQRMEQDRKMNQRSSQPSSKKDYTGTVARGLGKATDAAYLANKTHAAIGKSFWKIFNIALIGVFLGLLVFGFLFFSARVPGDGFIEKGDYVISNLGSKWQAINPFSNLMDMYEREFRKATGDYYTGEVDKNTQKDLGVFLEDIRPSKEHFYSDEPIVVWATFKAKTTLDEPMLVSVGCHGGETEGIVYPNKEFKVYESHEEAIDCKIPVESDIHGSGTHTVQLNADFGFTTRSYLLNYFIDSETYSNLMRQDKDVFDVYPVDDKSPSSQSENGPIQINIETLSEQPISVGQGSGTKPPIGITIRNLWEGEVKKVKELIFYTPSAIEVDTTMCNVGVERASSDQANYNAYKVTELDEFNDITNVKSFRCRMDVKSNELFEEDSFVSKYFKATVSYDYELQKGTTVNVKKS